MTAATNWTLQSDGIRPQSSVNAGGSIGAAAVDTAAAVPDVAEEVDVAARAAAAPEVEDSDPMVVLCAAAADAVEVDESRNEIGAMLLPAASCEISPQLSQRLHEQNHSR
jgi:hypothetical protein